MLGPDEVVVGPGVNTTAAVDRVLVDVAWGGAASIPLRVTDVHLLRRLRRAFLSKRDADLYSIFRVGAGAEGHAPVSLTCQRAPSD